MNLLKSLTSGYTDEVLNISAALILLIGGAAQQSQQLRNQGEVTQVVVKCEKERELRKKIRGYKPKRTPEDSLRTARYLAKMAMAKAAAPYAFEPRMSSLLTPNYAGQ